MKNTSSERWVTYLVAVTAVAVVLLLGLQGFGIWQPHEIRVADAARALLSGATDTPVQPPLQVRAVALGFRLGGVSELWGRLPTALLSFLSACALMAAARGAGDRRLAAYTGIAYATLPLVFMNARQMFGGGVAQSASTLALSGVVLAAWGREKRWRVAGVVIGAVGLLLAQGAVGTMVGVIPVLGALGLASTLRFSREERWVKLAGVVSLVASAGLMVKVALVLGRPELDGYSAWVGASSAGQAPTQWQTFEGYIENVLHATFPWTGFVPFGLVRLVSPPSRVPAGETERVIDADETEEADAWREAGMRLTAFLAIALGFGLQTLHMQLYGMTAFVVVAPIALGLAALLRDCERELAPWRTVAVVAGLFTVLMLRDLLQFPKVSYAALGLPGGGPTFPQGFTMKLGMWFDNLRAARASGGELPPLPAEGWFVIESVIFLALGVLAVFQGSGVVRRFAWAAPWAWIVRTETAGLERGDTEEKLFGKRSLGAVILANLRWVFAALAVVLIVVGLSVPGATPALTTPGRSAFKLIAALPVLTVAGVFAFMALWNFWSWIGRPEGSVSRVLGTRVTWVPLAATIVALVIVQGFVPALSEHMSPRGVWAVVRMLRHGDEPVARYGGDREDPATRYYTSSHPEVLTDENQAVQWLTGPRRSFLVLASDVFPSLNRAYRRARHENLQIADASNSNLYLAVSALNGRPNRNPLEPFVQSSRPRIRHPAREATRWQDTFEYIGYDLDSGGRTYVPLGGSFKISFHFHVLAESARNWQLFVHTDGQGPRINGDHEAVGGKYPTRYWLPGDYIRDDLTVNVPATYRAGIYTVYMGFFDGGDRMRLEGGEHDRDNRVIVARVRVQ